MKYLLLFLLLLAACSDDVPYKEGQVYRNTATDETIDLKDVGECAMLFDGYREALSLVSNTETRQRNLIAPDSTSSNLCFVYSASDVIELPKLIAVSNFYILPVSVLEESWELVED